MSWFTIQNLHQVIESHLPGPILFTWSLVMDSEVVTQVHVYSTLPWNIILHYSVRHFLRGWYGSGTTQINDLIGPTPTSTLMYIRTQKWLHNHFWQLACPLFSHSRSQPLTPPSITACIYTCARMWKHVPAISLLLQFHPPPARSRLTHNR